MKILYAAAAATVIGGTVGWFWPAHSQEQGPPPPPPSAEQGGPPGAMEQGGPPGALEQEGPPPAGAGQQAAPPGSMEQQGAPPGQMEQQGPPPGQMRAPPNGTMGQAPPASVHGGAQHMPMDTPVDVNGTEAVCTGVGEHAQQNPNWLAYPVRIEFSNRGAQYLSGAHVDLATGSGHVIASVDCDGAWVLFRVSAGIYRVSARLFSQPGGGTASATFAAPASGQKRVVLDFSLGPNQ